MSIKTTFSGKMQRFNGDNLELNKRVSGTVTVTEYGGNKISIAPGSTDISIVPAGLGCIRTVYIETDNKINVETTCVRTASFDLYANGIFVMLNASLSSIKLSNRSATLTAQPFYDLSG